MKPLESVQNSLVLYVLHFLFNFIFGSNKCIKIIFQTVVGVGFPSSLRSTILDFEESIKFYSWTKTFKEMQTIQSKILLLLMAGQESAKTLLMVHVEFYLIVYYHVFTIINVRDIFQMLMQSNTIVVLILQPYLVIENFSVNVKRFLQNPSF